MEHMDFATGKLTITDNIYNQILLKISDGTYPEGEKLPSEGEFCKLFNASRISVRSALQRLDAIGLIETFQGKGSYVKRTHRKASAAKSADAVQFLPNGDLSSETQEAFWQFRQPLSEKALELFVLRATEDDFAVLEQCVDNMINSTTQNELTQGTVDFYLYIYQHCGNPFIANAFTENADVLAASFRIIHENRRQTKASLVRWYGKVLDYLRKGDTQAVSITIAEENILHLRGISISEK